MDLKKKNGCFSGQIRPDWGNTARADMARLGSVQFRVNTFVSNNIF